MGRGGRVGLEAGVGLAVAGGLALELVLAFHGGTPTCWIFLLVSPVDRGDGQDKDIHSDGACHKWQNFRQNCFTQEAERGR